MSNRLPSFEAAQGHYGAALRNPLRQIVSWAVIRGKFRSPNILTSSLYVTYGFFFFIYLGGSAYKWIQLLSIGPKRSWASSVQSPEPGPSGGSRSQRRAAGGAGAVAAAGAGSSGAGAGARPRARQSRAPPLSPGQLRRAHAPLPNGLPLNLHFLNITEPQIKFIFRQ